VLFDNIVLPDHARIVVNDADGIRFAELRSVSGGQPAFKVQNSTEVIY